MSNAHRNEDHLADHEIVLAHIAASRGWAHGELTGSAEQVMGEARDRVDVERVVARNGMVWRIPDSEDRQSTVVIFLQRIRNPFERPTLPKHDRCVHAADAILGRFHPQTVLVSTELGMTYRVGGDQETLAMFEPKAVSA